MNMSEIIPAKYNSEQYKSLELWYDFMDSTFPVLREMKFHDIPEESSRFAVFIDNRKHPYMEYIFRNIMCFLGEGWGLQLFVWPENRSFVETIIGDWHHVSLVELQNENGITNPMDIVKRDEKFWLQVKGEKQLFFDLDSLLCRSGINDFINYDYVGAPWLNAHAISPVCIFGSGGLSLRNKNIMLDICRKYNTSPKLITQEDLFFSVNMHLESEKYCLPTADVAKQFAVESIFYPQPLGLHKPWVCIPPDQIIELLESINYSMVHD